jgi:uncharacterized protein (TIGR03086 family)
LGSCGTGRRSTIILVVSERLRDFTKAVYGMDAVVRRVPDDAWDQPSPCEGWSARDVVAHQVGVFDGIAHMAAGNEMILPTMPEDRSDPVGLWAEARDRVLATLDTEGALQHSGRYWFGPMSIDELLGITQWDPLTHAWDVARATGIDAVIDEELARKSFERISAIRPSLAKMRLVGDEVEVPEDADIVSRYLGLVGRDPAA